MSPTGCVAADCSDNASLPAVSTCESPQATSRLRGVAGADVAAAGAAAPQPTSFMLGEPGADAATAAEAARLPPRTRAGLQLVTRRLAGTSGADPRRGAIGADAGTAAAADSRPARKHVVALSHNQLLPAVTCALPTTRGIACSARDTEPTSPHRPASLADVLLRTALGPQARPAGVGEPRPDPPLLRHQVPSFRVCTGARCSERSRRLRPRSRSRRRLPNTDAWRPIPPYRTPRFRLQGSSVQRALRARSRVGCPGTPLPSRSLPRALPLAS